MHWLGHAPDTLLGKPARNTSRMLSKVDPVLALPQERCRHGGDAAEVDGGPLEVRFRRDSVTGSW